MFKTETAPFTFSPYIVIQGRLLEGPLYDEARNECRFIDIIDHKLYTFNPSRGPESLKAVTTQETIGVTANIKGSTTEQIVGARHGLATLNAGTGEVNLRCNDGAVDSRGRFWVGAMNDPLLVKEDLPHGFLMRLDPDHTVHRMVDCAFAPNGIGWNSTDNIMYWTDSHPQNIYAFDFDGDSGAISGKRVFWNSKTAGFGDDVNPDGLVVDEYDHVWTALWRGYKVVRINPQGVIVGEVCLPTAYVTCPIFVGTELVITTARNPKVQKEGIERGGDLYIVDVGITGPAKHEFRLQ
ncbi:regucalcin like protein [Pseudomassariella vexata]|uniref:Regucalcin like protein n=1 Tax=Pseudomassariella vexata TaxID=1141098 RepID=A0A1Y2EA02_9PEZI|nr:regucalcin like protein [Pseudomassariella vexata]ORY68410.1 regucalcin like protein [Pseudomassariella vexata]